MLIHADFSQRASVRPADHQWVPSPQSGVERVMLDRIGAEQARATSLVRYRPGSRFPAHTHPDGEEILVLAGTFSEGAHHYPAGWYMRNPDGSSHAPSSAEGATLFVKLRQMHPSERTSLRLNTRDAKNWHDEAGRQVCPLYHSAFEQVCLQRLHAGEPVFSQPPPGGAELLVLEGTLCEGDTEWETNSWLRLPPGPCPALITGPTGALFYLKTGHLHAGAV
ncbi:cupin domain-containing protein [Nissabacter sp. SGAir0207]|uniref:cupin domain-containing protein n=1 Tax=Nissabacter sp. SGAir0207 TaxID=2126321 RepID=UPI0010CD5EA3|nr:cupin domain-containing protein [Nissabacter sp. SGAir0207]QCR38203.1 anti-sigma factor [Nissabacter sp. SGAir0207]